MPLSIWDVLFTLASQRQIELDFAAIIAKMSPSLSQSKPTHRLDGVTDRWLKHKVTYYEQAT